MNRKYIFFDGSEFRFNDKKSVRELVQYAAELFGHEAPFGKESLTVYQAPFPKADKDWFTVDLDKRCAKEIKNRKELCFAHYLPGVLYYAEGGWGDWMAKMRNHPVFPDAVTLHFRFPKFRNTLVANGELCFLDLIKLFKEAGWIPESEESLVCSLGFRIRFSEDLMKEPLKDFVSRFYGEYVFFRLPK